MITALRWARPAVYMAAVAVAVGVYLVISALFPSSTLQMIRLTESYAFCAVIFLYLTLLVSPLYATFHTLPWKPVAVKARQALGLSALGFSLLHSSLALFGLLGGLPGLFFLSNSYIVAISLSATALLIMGGLAVSDIPPVHRRLGRWWKRLHRLIYVGALLVLIHALLLGTHFSNLSQATPQVCLAAVAVLLILETVRLDHWLRHHFERLPRFGPAFTIGLAILSVATIYLYAPAGAAPSLGIHAAHIQLAQQAAQNGGYQTSSILGLTGDRNKRYSVTFEHPDTVQAGQDTTIHFTVNDASNGNPTQSFETIYEKTSHLIIVDSQLQYFTHVHPDLSPPTFTITTQFPHPGMYHLYLDFQPFGAIEQQFGFSLPVGDGAINPATQRPDTTLTKTFGNYEVSMKTNGALKANLATFGQQPITFTLKDAKTKQPLTNLQPYLGAYGHMVMVNEQTYDYLHVHPNTLAANGNHGGPDVTFLPIGIYGPIKAGTYRVFVQFNPDGHLFTADFTVRIE